MQTLTAAGDTMVTIDRCCACGNNLQRPSKVLTCRDPFHVSEADFRVVRCAKCETWVLTPRPDRQSMAKYYDSDFLFTADQTKRSVLGSIAAAIQEFNLCSEVNWVKEHMKPSGSYLDYSAGNGQTITQIMRSCPQLSVFATEFSTVYRAWLSRVLPEGHVKGELSEFDRKFDLISAFGVLEHVEDPKQLLADIASHLAPGGKAIISVPNPHSLQLSLFGKDWYNWIAPRHFNLMPIKALRSLSESCGFEVVSEKHFFLRTNSGSFALSMFPSLDPLKKGPAWRLLAYAALFYGLIPAELLLSAMGAGGFMGVVLQKKQ